VLRRVSFGHAVVAVVVIAVIVGVVGYAISGTKTDAGTTGAIAAENARIISAENSSCKRFGRYGTLATLKSERLLTFTPTYNSVVYIPGKDCGTIVVGSSAYQSSAG
jgi:hypothetical protein